MLVKEKLQSLVGRVENAQKEFDDNLKNINSQERYFEQSISTSTIKQYMLDEIKKIIIEE